MKNRKLKLLSAVAVALCLSVAPVAQATILSNYLTFDGPQHTLGPVANQGGGEDHLIDDSLTRFVDQDGSGGFSAGDVAYGLVTLSELQASGRPSLPVGSSSQIAIIFSVEFGGAGSIAGSHNLIPITSAGNAAYTLSSL